ncbi:hypothetical protein [Halobacteriovorax sp. RT-1-4]|uniref:hypothetical protein n=1 Tax=unclassified Halobacteriovorax TaxID=2639665 RepID=UPI00399BA2AF
MPKMLKGSLCLFALLASLSIFANDQTDADSSTEPIPVPLSTACMVQGNFGENLPIRIKMSRVFQEWTEKRIIENTTKEECYDIADDIAHLAIGIEDVKTGEIIKTVSARLWFKNFETNEFIEDEVFRDL